MLEEICDPMYDRQTPDNRYHNLFISKQIIFLKCYLVMASKPKIILLGPCKVGKTVLSNFLTDPVFDQQNVAYFPTKGVRIVETPTCVLWDASGDEKYMECWPAIRRNADGIIMVFDPDSEDQESELINWYNKFVKLEDFPDSQCIVFANQISHMKGKTRDANLPNELKSIQSVATNTQENPAQVRAAFETFLKKIRAAKEANRDREELSIVEG
eukprot:m.188737 g.188737  ORF g.188737 m.188737 type:complete len:214 (+) comp15619_c0_seq7:486-1127(+)